MRFPSATTVLALALAPVSAIAAPAEKAAGDQVIREAIHAEPLPLPVLTDGLADDEAADGWRKREANEEMREALEEAIDMARSAAGEF